MKNSEYNTEYNYLKSTFVPYTIPVAITDLHVELTNLEQYFSHKYYNLPVTFSISVCSRPRSEIKCL